MSVIDSKALYKLSYGLFVITARENGKDNGCITNTAIQAASDKISVCVNKANLTHDMIASTGQFCLSVLAEDATFELFQRFGYQSGRDADKFKGFEPVARDEGGLIYLTRMANARISCEVTQAVDLGSHTLFAARIQSSAVLSNAPSATYAYYFEHIKPKPEQPKRKGWVCKICGYVYEGEELPADFVCPICKHGAADFERL